MVSEARPSPSVPRTTASFSSAIRWGSSISKESSLRAMAAVLNPIAFRDRIPSVFHSVFSSKKVHGIWNTVPMLTRIARRYSGLLHPGVSSTASIPRAAAERKIAPILVGFTTFSRTAILRAFLHTSTISGNAGRRIAQSIPLVSLNPVSCVNTSNSAV